MTLETSAAVHDQPDVTETDIGSENVTDGAWADAEREAAKQGRPTAEWVYDYCREKCPGHINDMFRRLGRWKEYCAIRHYREGTRPPANDREEAMLRRWIDISNETWGERSMTPAERKVVERVRKLGLVETRQHEKARELIEIGPQDKLSVEGLALAAACNELEGHPFAREARLAIFGSGDLEREVTPRHFRRMAQKYHRTRYEMAHPPTPEQMKRREEVRRFNKLFDKFVAFQNAWMAAPIEDRQLLLRNHSVAADMIADGAVTWSVTNPDTRSETVTQGTAAAE